MKLKEFLKEDDVVADMAIAVIKNYPSRLRYRREELRRLLRANNIRCDFSTSELKFELYQLQGYKTEFKL